MDRALRRSTHFVTDRPLFDACRRATGICLSPDEVFDLLETTDRQRLLGALARYDDVADPGAREFADGQLARIRVARATRAAGAARPKPATASPSAVPPVEWMIGRRHALGMEAVAGTGAGPTLVLRIRNRQGPRQWTQPDCTLDRDELPRFTAFLLRLTGEVQVGGSAARPLVSLRCRPAPASIVLCGHWARQNIALEPDPARLFHAAALALHQLGAATGLTAGALLLLLQATVGGKG